MVTAKWVESVRRFGVAASKWAAIEICVCRETVLHAHTIVRVYGNSYLYYHNFIYCNNGPKA